MSDEFPPAAERSPPAWRTPALIALAAFFAGLILMGLIFSQNRSWFGAKPAATLAPSTLTDPGTIDSSTPASGGAVTPANIDALSAREAALAARLADLEMRTASVGSDAQTASGYATRAEGMMLAFAARRAIDRGLGLGYVETQLQARFGATQPRAVATILQAAREPVTLEDLRVGLEAIAPELATGAKTDGWSASFRRELSNLIVIHKAGTPSPLPADRLTRARRLLEAGQVEPALAEVARTPGADEAKRWMSAAKSYIGVREALDTIETAAILGQGRVAQRPAPPVAPPQKVAPSDLPVSGQYPPAP